MRTEFLWVIFDHLQKNPEANNDAPEIAAQLQGKDGGNPRLIKVFSRVTEDALGVLRVAGLIRYESGWGYRPVRKISKDQFLKVFE